MSIPKLTLVGAGPGDPELITVKGARALADADVVLYDALVHPDLLNLAPASSEKIFVGKRAGKHQFSQDRINKLIVEKALNKGHVVRLKGGDPFVFGRGHEEVVYAELFDIKVEVVPGISSVIAVPELQRIPLTRRHVNESFWVITGTTRSGSISKDVRIAAKSSATVVILMGMGKLSEIANIFKKAGKSQTAVAVIQNGSWSNEKFGLGTVETINEVVKDKKLGSPAIIVIGDVVALHPEFDFEYVTKRYLSIEN